MDEMLMWLLLGGSVGGLLFLLEKGWDAAESVFHWWVAKKWREDFIDACADNGVQVGQLDGSHEHLRGYIEQVGLKHGFNVALPRRYHRDAMDLLVRAIAKDAGFDVPEREDG